jgi:Cu-processing system permease protein
VIWFITVVLLDVAALGVASLLRSGPASRLLILATLLNPVDAARTGTLLAIEGTGAFGAASLALLRWTHGPVGAGVAIVASLAAWIVAPGLVAAWRVKCTDI